MALSIGFLRIATESLPVGASHAVWVGIGTASTALFGIVFLTILRIFLIRDTASGRSRSVRQGQCIVPPSRSLALDIA
ncbi:MAG: hypothetical protein EPN34_05165 [Burkholderiaceae bacterium]|nr:MAG: hypothetical protein EPN34_05165 [Burkholderiaceae bacterium]